MANIAEEKKLYDDKYWLLLLHYKKNIFGFKSLIDDPKFFLSENGKYDPKAELFATIRAFFKESENEKERAACKFPARLHWLKEKLNIDAEKLPYPVCAPLENIIDNEIKPESISLIFPASHINSPASMFGHTLITVDMENKSKLLSHSINYAAITLENPGVIYALKGIFGFYRGYFTVLPYYAKIQEYSDYNYRDIWEYKLNLNREEIRMTLYHIIELENIYSDYYFFDENCSYNILFLLDVARPSLQLTDEFNYYIPFCTIPVETIRSIKNKKSVSTEIYRPSKVTKIKYIGSLLNNKNKDIALSVIDKKLTPEELLKLDVSNEEKIKISDLLIEEAKYLYTEEKMTKDEYTRFYLSILTARSGLGAPETEYNIPQPVPPEEGHLSNRINLGAGVDGGSVFQELKFRFAYHELTDAGEGFITGGQIIFGNMDFRYYSSDKKFRFNRLDIIDIMSLAPRDSFVKATTWKAVTGFSRKLLPDDVDHLVYGLDVGRGLTYESDWFGLFYVLAEADMCIGSGLENYFLVGAGASAGLLTEWTGFWKTYLCVSNLYYFPNNAHDELKLSLKQNFRITRNTAVIADLVRKKIYDKKFSCNFNRDLIELSFNLFF